MKEIEISLFTHPPFKVKNYGYYCKLIIKIAWVLIRRDLNAAREIITGGHPGVTQSLISGLNKINTSFSLNNYKKAKRADLVVVLSGISTLTELISMRKQGLISKLWAGPNIAILPSDCDYLLCNTYIDKILTPSEWVKEKYCKVDSSLSDKIIVWPSGTNLDFYPKNEFKSDRNNILIYHKYKVRNLLVDLIMNEIKSASIGANLSISEIFYGDYNKISYVRELSTSFLCFYLSDRPESQGLALQESWAMNVPTAVLRQDRYSNFDFTAKACSAPYLTDETGVVFDKIEEISKIISYYYKSRNKIASRAWVEQNLSDSICAKVLIGNYFKPFDAAEH